MIVSGQAPDHMQKRFSAARPSTRRADITGETGFQEGLFLAVSVAKSYASPRIPRPAAVIAHGEGQ